MEIPQTLLDNYGVTKRTPDDLPLIRRIKLWCPSVSDQEISDLEFGDLKFICSIIPNHKKQ